MVRTLYADRAVQQQPRTRFDEDIRSMEREGITAFIHSVFDSTFSETYWTIRLPQEMETSSTQSPYLLAFQAAQVKLQDKAFLSRDILVRELLTAHGDLHHIFPQNHQKKLAFSEADITRSPTSCWPKAG